MKYRKKPVVIEAVRLEGPFDSLVTTEVRPDWFSKAIFDGSIALYTDGHAEVCTTEGVMRGDIGDWIIKGVNGELYPCKPDVFEKFYDAVE